MWKNHHRLPAPKINWCHDCWTLTQIMHRRTGTEKTILQALVFLRAGISYTRTAKLTHKLRAQIVNWALLYNQGYGLELLVKPVMMIAPLHGKRIEAFLKENPSQFSSLMSGTDLELYAEWADVDPEMLAAWILQREYYGEKLFVRTPKRSYTRSNKRNKRDCPKTG